MRPARPLHFALRLAALAVATLSSCSCEEMLASHRKPSPLAPAPAVAQPEQPQWSPPTPEPPTGLPLRKSLLPPDAPPAATKIERPAKPPPDRIAPEEVLADAPAQPVEPSYAPYKPPRLEMYRNSLRMHQGTLKQGKSLRPAPDGKPVEH